MSSPFILSQAEAESRAGDTHSEAPRCVFAGQLCYILATCWYVALCISALAVPGCAVQWNKVRAGSRSCPVLWQIPQPSVCGAGCSMCSARGHPHPWLRQKQLSSAQTVPVPMGCEGQSSLSPWKLKRSCGKWEAGTPVRPLLNMLVFCATSL